MCKHISHISERIAEDRKIEIVKRIIGIIVCIGFLGCGGQLKELAVETMENAQVTLTTAEATGAQETQTAQELLDSARAALEAGDTERAYRLALRAYLHARIATETTLAVQLEAELQEAEAQLVVNRRRAAEVHKELTDVQAELEAMR